MKNDLKNDFDFLNDKSVLILTNDKDIEKKTNNILLKKLNKIDYSSSLSNLTKASSYNLIVVDDNCVNLKTIEEEFYKEDIKTPVIYLTNDINMDILKYSKKITLRNILQKDFQLDNILLYTTMILQNKYILQLKNGYSFCLNENRLLLRRKEISLTKLELAFIKKLVMNKNKIVSYDEIKQSVWKNKDVSQFSMRNVVNKIRTKSYYNIIENVSGQGYIIKNYDYL